MLPQDCKISVYLGTQLFFVFFGWYIEQTGGGAINLALFLIQRGSARPARRNMQVTPLSGALQGGMEILNVRGWEKQKMWFLWEGAGAELVASAEQQVRQMISCWFLEWT